MNYKFIESEAELENICGNLLKENVIGVDLEADSLHCFEERICLIQIAAEKEVFLIDPFEFKDLSCFLEILENSSIIKVFHGADFDIRSLDRDYHIRVKNLFDTEIACRFLGIKERGLQALLKRNFNIDADKKYQRANWSKRPFQPEMIRYAAMDVEYLIRLYKVIRQKLVERQRLSWAEEEFDIQVKVRYENYNTLPLFRRFKGAGKMDSRTLAVLENLLQVRMRIAKQKNKPLFKIMSNASLISLSENKPETIDQILKMKALSRKQVNMYGSLCLEAVVKAMTLESEKLPVYPKTKRAARDRRVESRMARLKTVREKLSSFMEIEPGFLLSNALINAIALKKPENFDQLLNIKNIRRWQVENIGDQILKAC